jgi:hypothetical protein
MSHPEGVDSFKTFIQADVSTPSGCNFDLNPILGSLQPLRGAALCQCVGALPTQFSFPVVIPQSWVDTTKTPSSWVIAGLTRNLLNPYLRVG